MLYIFDRLFGITNYPNTKAEIEAELKKGTLVKGSAVTDVFSATFNFLKTPIIILFLILGISIFAKTGLFTGIFSK